MEVELQEMRTTLMPSRSEICNTFIEMGGFLVMITGKSAGTAVTALSLSKQLLGGLQWNALRTFMVPRG